MVSNLISEAIDSNDGGLEMLESGHVLGGNEGDLRCLLRAWSAVFVFLFS